MFHIPHHANIKGQHKLPKKETTGVNYFFPPCVGNLSQVTVMATEKKAFKSTANKHDVNKEDMRKKKKVLIDTLNV